MSQVRETLRMRELDFSSKNSHILRVSRIFSELFKNLLLLFLLNIEKKLVKTKLVKKAILTLWSES
jgi:hypothetical protein